MNKANKTALTHFPESAMRCFLIPTYTAVVGPQNEFIRSRSQTFRDDSDVQAVPVKHDFGETFYREKFYG